MKRELGNARCGLACCLCSENGQCNGCEFKECPDKDSCVIRAYSFAHGLSHSCECTQVCQKGMLSKIKPYGFTILIKRYGMGEPLNGLEWNEKNGIVYHRNGILCDCDDFDDVKVLIHFIKTGKQQINTRQK